MSHFLVRGGRRLDGQLTVQGAKNSVLPILAATLLARGQVVLLGCPRLRDVDASIRILHHLGCDARWEADASWAPGPSICTCPACGSWGRRSGRREASSTAGRRPWWAGNWCCGCPPWAPRRT